MPRGDGGVSPSVWIGTAVGVVVLVVCVTVVIVVIHKKKRDERAAQYKQPRSSVARMSTPVAVATTRERSIFIPVTATETGVRRQITVDAAEVLPPASEAEFDAIPVATSSNPVLPESEAGFDAIPSGVRRIARLSTADAAASIIAPSISGLPENLPESEEELDAIPVATSPVQRETTTDAAAARTRPSTILGMSPMRPASEAEFDAIPAATSGVHRIARLSTADAAASIIGPSMSVRMPAQ